MKNIDLENYRVDVQIKYYNAVIYSIDDLIIPLVVYPLMKSGQYSVQIVVTDHKTCNQEVARTHQISYCPSVICGKEALKRIRDIREYCNALYEYVDDLFILISSRDAHTREKTDRKYLAKLNHFRVFNLSTDLISTFRYSFLAVIDGGIVLCEETSAEQAIERDIQIESHTIRLCSKGYNCTRNNKVPIEISIDGRDYAVNHRGLNIVVWDKKTDKLLDSVCFDMFGNEAVYRNEGWEG